MKVNHLLLLLVIFLPLSNCMTKEERLLRKLSKDDAGNVVYKGHYKIGKEYVVKNKIYKPKKYPQYTEIGLASWYGETYFHKRPTANGDKYNKHALTAAHRELPLPSLVKVTNLSNNKSVILMVNDRGPFVKDRIIDVSKKAAEILDFKLKGITKVKVEYLPKDTEEFLANIKLPQKEGSRTKTRTSKKHCSVNCHVKLVNIKHKLYKPD